MRRVGAAARIFLTIRLGVPFFGVLKLPDGLKNSGGLNVNGTGGVGLFSVSEILDGLKNSGRPSVNGADGFVLFEVNKNA